MYLSSVLMCSLLPPASSRKTRAVVMAAVVLVVFVVCFTPTNVILMVHYAGLSGHSADVSYQAYLLFMCVGSVSCCLDPVLYYFGSSQCQKKVAALLRCRRPAQASKSCGMESTKTSRWTDSRRSCMMESIQSDPGSQYSRLMPTWKKASWIWIWKTCCTCSKIPMGAPLRTRSTFCLCLGGNMINKLYVLVPLKGLWGLVKRHITKRYWHCVRPGSVPLLLNTDTWWIIDIIAGNKIERLRSRTD